MSLDESARLVLQTIIALMEADRLHRPPSYRRVGEQIKKSIGFVQDHVKVLKSEGFLHIEPGHGGFHVLKNPDGSLRRQASESSTPSTVRLPILGFAAAGRPIEAVDSDPEMFPVPSEWCRGTCYLLRIRGDSMSGDGIEDGDLVLVQATDEVQPGAIHVCWLPGDGATIKRVKKSKAAAAQLVEEALTARRLNQLKRTVRKGPWQLKDALTVEQVEAIPDTAQTFADEILEELRTARAAAVYAAELAEFSAAAMWRLLKQTDDYKDRSLEQYQDIQRKIKKQAREVVRDNLEKRLEQEAERADE